MGQVIKAYLGIFLMMLLLAAGAGVIAAEVEICRARDFKTDVVTELENSNFHPDVIAACRQQAEDMGYDLQIDTYADGDGIRQASVTLVYSYRLGPFHTDTEHVLRGIAR